MRVAYVAGYSNGYQYAATMAATASESTPNLSKQLVEGIKAVRDCQLKMTAGQMSAVIDKSLRDHPEKWHEHISGLVFDALLGAATRPSKTK